MTRGKPGVLRSRPFNAGQRIPRGFAALFGLLPLLTPGCSEPDTALDGMVTTCTDCVRVSPVTSLSSSEAAFVPSTVQNVVSIPSGGFAVSHPFGDPVIALYDHEGRYVRLVGRRGEGPGEFTRGLFLLPGPGDTVLASEPTTHRLHRFAGDLDHVDTRRIDLEVVGTGVSLPGGRLVVDDVRAVHPDGSHALISILGPEGALHRVVETTPERGVRPILAAGEGGGFWTLAIRGTELRRYDDDGELERVLGLSGTGVEDPSGAGEASPGTPIRQHRGVVDLGTGRILVLTWVPAAPSTLAGDGRAPPGGLEMNLLDRDRLFDTLVHLVDSETGEILGSARAPVAALPVGGNATLLFSAAPDAMGHVETQIWRVEVGC